MSKEDFNKQEIRQIERFESDVNYKNYNATVEPKKNIFIRFKDSIYHKPEKTDNPWKLLTNLTNTQRITFAAGK